MLTNILRCSAVLLILLVGIVRATPVSNASLSAKDIELRQAKAAEILKYMNTSVDPCEDFYEFACGNYATLNPATADMPGTGLLETLQIELGLKIKSILATDDVADAEIDKKVKRFYRSCMMLPSLENVTYTDKLKGIISEFGQMPVLEGETWQEENFDWMRTMAEIAFKYGVNIFIELGFAMDFANNTANRMYVEEQEFDVSKSMYLDEENIEKLAQIAVGYAWNLERFLGIDEQEALNTAIHFIKLERSLAKEISDKQSGLQLSEVFVLRSIDEVHQRYSPDLDFKQLINMTFGSIPNLKVYTDDAYLENLIATLNATSKTTLANYIFYRLSTAFIVDLSEAETEKEREDICLSHLKTYFYKNLDNMVYRKYNTKDIEKGVNNMWSDIKAAFQNKLQSQRLSWINEDTRKYAVEKLMAMELEVISYENNHFIEELGQLNFSNEDYIGNLKVILSSKASQERAKIGEEVQKIDFGKELSTTPAYILLENSIKIPVALLQPYYTWSVSFPNAFNFGVLGSLLSHELLHGYDSDGRTFDAQGNNREWWDEDSDNDFNHRSKCLIDQYKEYSYGGRHLPKMANQDENIADNGGARLAYTAYLNWYENAVNNNPNVIEESLPGLNYNHKQLYFLSYAHLWCSDVYSEYRTLMLASDSHVPDKFRVIGPLSNFEEFSKQFNCPKGSAMNAATKCSIY